MLSIGEFSRFAQVTTELLRHYDRFNLLKPGYIDHNSGYRYYHIEQLTDLNRILALKELGLSLEQIRQVVYDHISPEEIRDLLVSQKRKAEEAIREEILRLKRIESRLHYLESSGVMPEYDILTKTTRNEHWLSISRLSVMELTVSEFFNGVYTEFKQAWSNNHTHCVCAMNSLEFESPDWEMGFIVTDTSRSHLPILHNHAMTLNELPGYDVVASVLYRGDFEGFHLAYSALGQWVNHHALSAVGKAYEFIYHLDSHPTRPEHLIEVQMPLVAYTPPFPHKLLS